MKELMREAVQLFEEVMFHGAEHVIEAMEGDVWREYSREQLQLLKLLEQFGPIQAGQLAMKQGVHKSAVSNRLKKLVEKQLVVSRRGQDQRERLIELTAAGHHVVEQADTAVYHYVESLLDGKIDETEIEQFVRTFRKIKELLRIGEE
ncbi:MULTISPECIES: MarR family winged helix-turn-helix transcriptional regulator [unclassified Exiguobacterium]|uniref:MarR family winged helix-turn-helix transcriptional regulator n=1 Tax=unclassified Exiguobacterium TaxID=2644629 RepID=UPI0010405A31|nr:MULTISPECIES: MarR family transcriptional regulator [unclassified Exiguobacterium]TCI36583.1 MarR family transcriptional regulator [Exiguobacterium sp. SH4S7]TCI48635.1 MarR family transcriptional regulator [Exiguobacterium sp. SH5S32]TCI55521.1 MarR family transcriptional regulator [Exiguobacterium sp. SH1S4]TCI75318.1 MarR family transcriptional regulator [Exiguobacterium sp. SH1S1]